MGQSPPKGETIYINSCQFKLSTWFVWWLPEGTVIHPTKMNHQHGFLIQWAALFWSKLAKRIQEKKGCRCLYLPWWHWHWHHKVPSISKQSTSNKNDTKHPDHCLTILPPEDQKDRHKIAKPRDGHLLSQDRCIYFGPLQLSLLTWWCPMESVQGNKHIRHI